MSATDCATDSAVAISGLLDDEQLARRILQHIVDGTTDLADAAWQERVDNYREPERLTQEIGRVLRRYPTPFCPSASLPTAGSYVARDAAGVPIVAVRGRDRIVRAFRNSCRHRGTALVSGLGCERSLVCPYHGWVYRLDGSLRHVPGEHGFPDLYKDDRGLVPVVAQERGGIVFVTQDDSSAFDGALDCLPCLIGDDQQLLGVEELVVQANWKVFLEGFLEGYHIRSTHPTTFFPFGFDNVTVVETFGRNSRVTFPFRRIAKFHDLPAMERSLDGLVTFVHQIFPNTIVARLSHFTTLVILEPQTIGRTQVVTYQLTNRHGDDARSNAKRDSSFVNQGAIEDRDMACAVQRGLSSSANTTVEFGLFEGALSHFHRELNELLEHS